MSRIPQNVLASGKFDLIHPGHLFYLKKSKELASNGNLNVVITNEKNIRNCLFSNIERKEMIENLGIADYVVVGERKINYNKILKRFEPDIISLGHDQEPNGLQEALENYKGKIEIKRIRSLKPEKYSSSRYKKIFKNRDPNLQGRL